jgi:hypothetical protein
VRAMDLAGETHEVCPAAEVGWAWCGRGTRGRWGHVGWRRQGHGCAHVGVPACSGALAGAADHMDPGTCLAEPLLLLVCLLAVPQDFLEMLPVPFYTLPKLGVAPLNLASALVGDDNPTDLGPKNYITYGRLEEGTEGKEGDSVTKLHLDMTDAVNICLHAQYAPGEQVVARYGDAEADKPRWVCGWVGGGRVGEDAGGASVCGCPGMAIGSARDIGWQRGGGGTKRCMLAAAWQMMGLGRETRSFGCWDVCSLHMVHNEAVTAVDAVQITPYGAVLENVQQIALHMWSCCIVDMVLCCPALPSPPPPTHPRAAATATLLLCGTCGVGGMPRSCRTGWCNTRRSSCTRATRWKK